MNTRLLGSGSGGNAVLIESGDTRVLIDAGFPRRVLARRLERAGVAPESIVAVLVTHEHVDHARGVAACASRWGWRVIGTAGTLAACGDLPEATVIGAGDTVSVGSFDLSAVPVPHDAAEPIAVVATDRASGVRVGIAYDLGRVTDAVRAAFTDLDTVVVESNHDEGLLRASPYPPSVMFRIAGPRGHLSNRAAAELVRAIAWRGLRHVVLAHLSETCNDPALAVTAMRAVWRGPLVAATQDGLCAIGAPDQLSLGL